MTIATVGSTKSHAGYSYVCAKKYKAVLSPKGLWRWEKISEGPDRRSRNVANRDATEMKADLTTGSYGSLHKHLLTPEELYLLSQIGTRS